MLFRKRPVLINAEQFHPNRHPWPEGVIKDEKSPTGYSIGTLENVAQGHEVTPGDWIITGVKGERYPCKPDIFDATYDAAEGGEPEATPAPASGLRVYPINQRVKEQIENNFVYHSPNEEQARRYGYLRSQLRALAWEIAERTPPSREQSVALTKLEEVGFWMNAAVARNETEPQGQSAATAG